MPLGARWIIKIDKLTILWAQPPCSNQALRQQRMNKEKISFAGVFSGRYAAKSENLAIGAMNFFGCTKEQAIRLGKAYAADIGKFRRKEVGVETKEGRVDGDDFITIKEIEEFELSGKTTPAIHIARTVAICNKACNAKNNIVYVECYIQLLKPINDWLCQTGIWTPEEKDSLLTEAASVKANEIEVLDSEIITAIKKEIAANTKN